MRGDHYVTLVVQVPDKLSHEAKELLRKFDEESGDSLNAAKRLSGGGDDKGSTPKKKKGIFK